MILRIILQVSDRTVSHIQHHIKFAKVGKLAYIRAEKMRIQALTQGLGRSKVNIFPGYVNAGNIISPS